jgi:alpha-glucosidase
MFSMIGTPNIYYGDEVEIEGFTDEVEGCRYPFPWEKDYKNTKHYPLYQRLCHLKTSEKALKYGGLKILSHEKSTLVFARTTLDETIITIFNLTNEDQIISINPKIFNIAPKIINEDLLNTKLNTKLENDNLLIEVKANKSYLLKL